MKIRSLVNADYEEWRGLWLSYLNFYETSLADEVINETFYRFIDDHQTKQNALVAEDEIGLVGLSICPSIHCPNRLVGPDSSRLNPFKMFSGIFIINFILYFNYNVIFFYILPYQK